MNNKLALKLIETALSLVDKPVARQKHFSFILNRNKPIAIGWNDAWKTHTLAKKFGHRFSNLHSELAVILAYSKQDRKLTKLHEYDFANVRIMADGSVGLSRPCGYCQTMLTAFGLREVWFSLANGSFDKEELIGR